MVMYYKAEVVAIFLASGKKQCVYMFKMISKTNKSRGFFSSLLSNKKIGKYQPSFCTLNR